MGYTYNAVVAVEHILSHLITLRKILLHSARKFVEVLKGFLHGVSRRDSAVQCSAVAVAVWY